MCHPLCHRWKLEVSKVAAWLACLSSCGKMFWLLYEAAYLPRESRLTESQSETLAEFRTKVAEGVLGARPISTGWALIGGLATILAASTWITRVLTPQGQSLPSGLDVLAGVTDFIRLPSGVSEGIHGLDSWIAGVFDSGFGAWFAAIVTLLAFIAMSSEDLDDSPDLTLIPAPATWWVMMFLCIGSVDGWLVFWVALVGIVIGAIKLKKTVKWVDIPVTVLAACGVYLLAPLILVVLNFLLLFFNLKRSS